MVKPFKSCINEVLSFLSKQYFHFITRKYWTLEEDIKILEESIVFPKKWAYIARKLQGRNQHQIKNRFISILSKDACKSRKSIEELIHTERLISMTKKALNNWKILQSENNEDESMRIVQETFGDNNGNF